MSKIKEDSNPKIYVACLAAYNDGKLHGAWVNAHQDVDFIYEEIREMLSASHVPNAEEWAIHDFDGFYSCEIDEYANIESVAQIAALISEHGEIGGAVLKYLDYEVETAQEWMCDHYQGIYNSEEDFAKETMEDLYSIPDYLQNYIDYQLVARDWFLSDYVSLEIGHQVAVFSN